MAARFTRCDGVVRRDSVLCLDRLPARIKHAGPGDSLTRGAALHLASCTRHRRATGIATHRCSASRTRNAVGPPDITSIANAPDPRNPPAPGCYLRARLATAAPASATTLPAGGGQPRRHPDAAASE